MNSSSQKLLGYSISILLVLTIGGCQVNGTYKNRESDKRDGEAVAIDFFELLSKSEHQKIYNLFSERFYEVSDTLELKKLLDMSNEQLGEIENFEIEDWETESVVGTNSQVKYGFLYNVKRSKFPSKETIVLQKEKDDIKILSYNVKSEGFNTN